MSDDAVDVVVRGLASGGAGIADLPDGRVVFVPRTAPGDRARIRIERSRPRWARGSLVTLLEPSSDRVAPACARYAECGGCQLQHLRYADQLSWKGRFVADALTRIGGFDDVAPPEVVPSPRELHYRNRVSFTLRRLGRGRVVAGLHALGRPAHVIDIRSECVLPDERLMAAWAALRDGWGPEAGRLPSVGRLRLTLRLDPDGVDLVVEGGRPGWDAAPLFDAVDGLRAIWHVATAREAEADADADSLLAGPSPALVAGAVDAVAAPAFAQVNERAADLLREHVLTRCRAAAPDGDTRSAIDAYCGVGGYGAALAEDGWHVTGIESDPAAVARAEQAGGDTFRVLAGRVETTLRELLPADLLVLNPPRTGIHDDVPGQILTRPPRRVVYVSCDPATLARDLSRLGDGYALEGLRAFDLFPQTAHVETVAELSFRSTPA